MCLEIANTALVLLAPAWRFWRVTPKVRPQTSTIIHSRNDVLVPFAHSEELVRLNPTVRLIAAGQDHRMNDAAGRRALREAVESVLGVPSFSWLLGPIHRRN